MYSRESDKREILMFSNGGKIDIDVKKQWRELGADASQMEMVVKDSA